MPEQKCRYLGKCGCGNGQRVMMSDGIECCTSTLEKFKIIEGRYPKTWIPPSTAKP